MVHVCASTGNVVIGAGGMVEVTGATGAGVWVVQPARRTAAMQRRSRNIVFLSILKISRTNDKTDGDCEKFCTFRVDMKKGSPVETL